MGDGRSLRRGLTFNDVPSIGIFLKRNCTLHNAIQSRHAGVGPGVGVGVGVGIKAPTPESESTPMKTLSTPQPCKIESPNAAHLCKTPAANTNIAYEHLHSFIWYSVAVQVHIAEPKTDSCFTECIPNIFEIYFIQSNQVMSFYFTGGKHPFRSGSTRAVWEELRQ